MRAWKRDLLKSVWLTGVVLMTQGIGWAGESLWLPSIFSENMVLQREMPVPIWGRAKPGVPVAVTLYDGGKKLAAGEAVAAADTGRWRVDLPALPTGGRYTLLIEAKGATELETERRIYSNVLVARSGCSAGSRT